MGERAGNAALEEVAVAIKQLENEDSGIDLAALPGLAALVARAASRDIAPDKPITGRDVFTHESGIHVAGLLNEQQTYQGLDPALIGRFHSIALGKHSGTTALAHVLEAKGHLLGAEEAETLLKTVRRTASARKKVLSPDELIELHTSMLNQCEKG
jgi:homocitrate synthase NifV